MANLGVKWINRDSYPVVKDDGLVTSWTNDGMEYYTVNSDYPTSIQRAKNSSSTGLVKSNTFSVKEGELYRICLNANKHNGVVTGPGIYDSTTGANLGDVAPDNLTTSHIERTITITSDATAEVRFTCSGTGEFGIDEFTIENLTNRNPFEKDYKNVITCYPIMTDFTGTGSSLSTLSITDPLPDSFQGNYEYTIVVNENKAASRQNLGAASININMYAQLLHTPQFPETLTESEIRDKIEASIATWPSGMAGMSNPDFWHVATAISTTGTTLGQSFCNGWVKDGGYAPWQSITGALGTNMHTTASLANKRLLIYFGRPTTTVLVRNQPFRVDLVKNQTSELS